MYSKVKTKFGVVSVSVLDGQRICVFQEQRDINAPQSPHHERGLTINGVEYNIRFYCRAFEGEWKIIEPGTARVGPQCIDGTRTKTTGNFSNDHLTFAAQKAIAEHVFPAVIDFLKAHPEVLDDANLIALRAKRDKLTEEIKTLRKILSEKEEDLRAVSHECASNA
jgi:hypothetical protein